MPKSRKQAAKKHGMMAGEADESGARAGGAVCGEAIDAMLEPGLGDVTVDEAVADDPCHVVYEPQTQEQTCYEGGDCPKPEAAPFFIHFGELAFFVSERIKETVHTGAVRAKGKRRTPEQILWIWLDWGGGGGEDGGGGGVAVVVGVVGGEAAPLLSLVFYDVSGDGDGEPEDTLAELGGAGVYGAEGGVVEFDGDVGGDGALEVDEVAGGGIDAGDAGESGEAGLAAGDGGGGGLEGDVDLDGGAGVGGFEDEVEAGTVLGGEEHVLKAAESSEEDYGEGGVVVGADGLAVEEGDLAGFVEGAAVWFADGAEGGVGFGVFVVDAVDGEVGDDFFVGGEGGQVGAVDAGVGYELVHEVFDGLRGDGFELGWLPGRLLRLGVEGCGG